MNLDRIIAVRNEKTLYREGDKTIKVFHRGYSKGDILSEALNQARIEETGLNIPKILEVSVVDGKWAIVYEYIKGKSLAQLMKENPEKKEEYLELFVDLQMEIHTKTCPFLRKMKDEMNRTISDSELDATTRYDLHTRLDSMPKHNKVCHGDFNPSNVIISEEDGKPYILDWSQATQGNASADAASTYLVLQLEGDMELAERYLELFSEKSDITKRYVEKWLPIVAASQSIRGRKKEREALLSLANATDYE